MTFYGCERPLFHPGALPSEDCGVHLGSVKVLIVGAGTMGMSHGWLLSSAHEVTFLVRAARAAFYQHDVELHVHDLRPHRADQVRRFRPRIVCSAEPGQYDIVLVMVDRPHLSSALPAVEALAGHCPVVFMLNHWDIESQVTPAVARSGYLLGFPSQVGGGREGHRLDVTIFPEGTVLEAPAPSTHDSLLRVRRLLESAGLTVRWQTSMPDWMAVHSMQQSLTAAPVLESGGYEAFCHDRQAVEGLVRAFTEGLRVCRARGIRTWRIWPSPLFLLPTPLVTTGIQKMLQQPETTAMVTGHMRHGLADWVAGFRDLYACAQALGVHTPELDHHHQVIEQHWRDGR